VAGNQTAAGLLAQLSLRQAKHVHITPTDAGGSHLNQHLPGFGFGFRNIAYNRVLVARIEYSLHNLLLDIEMFAQPFLLQIY
jgi:hypothetical protein